MTHQATSLKPSGGNSLTHQVRVWINSSPVTLSNIQKVVYHLHPTFNPAEITGDKPEDKFAISLSALGEFEIKATV